MKLQNNPKRILIALAFFAISIGLWGNFRQLWLSDNLLSASEIAKTMSYASLLAALYLVYYTNVVSINKLKLGIIITLTLKIVVTTALSFVNGCQNIHLIKFLFFVDIACENIILASIYPFMISYQKSEELYGKKSVVEYTFKTVGILLASIFFGKVILSHSINYNDCLIISILFLGIALFLILQVNEYEKSKKPDSRKGLFQYIKKEKKIRSFLMYTFFTQTSYYIAFGLNMLVITNYLDFSANKATNYILFLSILASIFGQLALKTLRNKNDYINFLIKFLGRWILYILIFITNSKAILFLGISYLLITSVAYDYVISGFIYDCVKEQFMMSLTLLQYIINLLGEALGVFFAGIMYGYGFRYIYLFAACIMVIQLIIGCYLIHLKRIEKAIN